MSTIEERITGKVYKRARIEIREDKDTNNFKNKVMVQVAV